MPLSLDTIHPVLGEFATSLFPVGGDKFSDRRTKAPYGINTWQGGGHLTRTGGSSVTSALGFDAALAGVVVIDTDLHYDESAGKGIRGEDVLLDAVRSEGVSLPKTFTVRTPSGGIHRYYRAGGHRIPTTTGALTGVDYRAGWVEDRYRRPDGTAPKEGYVSSGYVLAPGSVTWNEDRDPTTYKKLGTFSQTGAYEVIVDAPIADLPDDLAEFLNERAAARRGRTHVHTGHAAPVADLDGVVTVMDETSITALSRAAEAMREAGEGSRNDTLNRVVFTLAQGRVPATSIEKAIVPAALSAGLDEGEIYSVLGRALEEGYSTETWREEGEPDPHARVLSAAEMKSWFATPTASKPEPAVKPEPAPLSAPSTVSFPPESGDGEDGGPEFELDDYDPIPASEDEEDEERSSWHRVDLTAYLDGSYVPPRPTIGYRTDGVALIYPGLVSSLYGESESGKSLVCQSIAASVLADGGTVYYVDYESGPGEVADRLLQMGATASDLLSERYAYIHPDVEPSASDEDNAAFAEEFAQEGIDLVVIDGVTSALQQSGLATESNDEVTRWMKNIPEKISTVTGAAVVTIDHVVKSTESRGRHALGAQAKMAALTGAGYYCEAKTSLGEGIRGELLIHVTKDRPGQVRPHGGEFTATRMQTIAAVTVDSTEPGKIDITINPPADVAARLEDPDVIRWTDEQKAEKFSLEKIASVIAEAEKEGVRTTKTTVFGRYRAMREGDGKGMRDARLDSLVEMLTGRGYVRQEKEGRGIILRTVSRYYASIDLDLRNDDPVPTVPWTGRYAYPQPGEKGFGQKAEKVVETGAGNIPDVDPSWEF